MCVSSFCYSISFPPLTVVLHFCLSTNPLCHFFPDPQGFLPGSAFWFLFCFFIHSRRESCRLLRCCEPGEFKPTFQVLSPSNPREPAARVSIRWPSCWDLSAAVARLTVAAHCVQPSTHALARPPAPYMISTLLKKSRRGLLFLTPRNPISALKFSVFVSVGGHVHQHQHRPPFCGAQRMWLLGDSANELKTFKF